MEINLLYGKWAHAELGIGVTPFVRVYQGDLLKLYDTYPYYMGRLGVRLQPPSGGFFIRLGLLRIIRPPDLEDDMALPKGLAGIGFGYTFKNKKH